MIIHQNSNYATNILYKNLILEIIESDLFNDRPYFISAPVRTKENIGQNDITHDKVRLYYQNKIKKYHRAFYHNKIKTLEKSLLSKVNPDDIEMIHAMFQFTDGGVAYEIYKKHKIPYIISVKDTDLNIFYKYLFHLRSYGHEIIKHASKVIFLTPCYREKLLSTYLPQELHSDLQQKSKVIPNGIDNFWHQNTGVPKKLSTQNNIKIAHVGEINKRKNLNTVLQVAQKLIQQHYDVTVDIAGKPHGKYGQKMIAKINSLAFCNYHGIIKDKHDLLAVFKNADILIVPSLRESFGLVYAESMSQGTPVIYTKGEGFDGQFPDGTVGYPCEAENVEDIISKIQLIQKHYETISQNCIQHVTKFKWASIANEFTQVYEEVLS